MVKACMPKPSSIRLVVLIQYRLVTDRQTDGHITTSRRQRIPRYSIASRGKTDLTSAPNAKRGSLYREQLAFYRRQCIELQSVHDNRCSDVLHWHDSLITVNSPTEEPAQLSRPAPSHGFQSQYNAAAFPSCGSALFSRKKSKNRKYSIRQFERFCLQTVRASNTKRRIYFTFVVFCVRCADGFSPVDYSACWLSVWFARFCSFSVLHFLVVGSVR